ADLPAKGADDAGGQRLVEPIRVADGVDGLADLQLVGIAEQDGDELALGSADAQDGEVLVRRDADGLGTVGGLVGEGDVNGVGTADDVIVGYDVAGLVPDEAGPCAHAALRGVGERALGDGLGGDVDDGGARLLVDLDAALFELRQVAARRDGAGLAPQFAI